MYGSSHTIDMARPTNRQEAERLRQIEERKAELLGRARRRAKTKVEAAIGT